MPGRASLDEPKLDVSIALRSKENSDCALELAACPSRLLIVLENGTGHSRMDDKADVLLVVPHAQSGGCDESLELVRREQLLGVQAFVGRQLRMVRQHIVAPVTEPGGRLLRVEDGRRIDDSDLRKLVQRLIEPCEPRGWAWKPVSEEPQVRSVQVPLLHRPTASQEAHQVFDDRGRRGGGGGEQGGVGGEPRSDANDLSVVGPKVMPPLAQAMSFVDDQEPPLSKK